MFEILRTERFNIIASCILGIAIMAVLKTPCKENCTLQKAPSTDEITKTTYQLGSKCYQFKMNTMQCPQNGPIIGV